MTGQETLRLATITRSYNLSGKPYCDCRTLGLGAVDLFRVPIGMMGGGTSRYLLLPTAPPSGPEDGAMVVIGYLEHRKPVVLCSLGHNAAKLFSGAAADQDGEDQAPEVDKDTASWNWDGAAIKMRGGAVTVQAAGGKDITAAVDGAALRVSNNGDASDWAVLARALVAELAVAYERINALNAQVAALTPYVQACASALTITPPPPSYTGGALEPVKTTDIAAKVLRVSGEIGG